MEERALTPEYRERIYLEIGRISAAIHASDCLGCARSLALMVNHMAAILAGKQTIKEFLVRITEQEAGPKVVDFYLEMFDY